MKNGSVTQRTEHIYDAFNRLSGQSWTPGADSLERYAYSDGEKGDGSLTSMTAATGDSLSLATTPQAAESRYGEKRQLRDPEHGLRVS